MRYVRLILLAAIAAIPGRVRAQADTLPTYLRDRGRGIPTSMFGTYVAKGELLVYPFYEYYHDRNAEYKPEELGYGLDQDFRGKFRASEGLLFVSYGFSDRFAAEFEAAVMSARLYRAPEDPSAMPGRLRAAGLGDVEGQFRWRWHRESASRPEAFSYVEAVLPLQKQKPLIGTSDWEFSLGTGVIRGYRWGTVMLRGAIEYDAADASPALGELAVEYLKRVSPRLQLLAAVEASQDEVELITESQIRLRRNLVLKLNNGFGVSSKATDWAPEIGLMFSFR